MIAFDMRLFFPRTRLSVDDPRSPVRWSVVGAFRRSRLFGPSVIASVCVYSGSLYAQEAEATADAEALQHYERAIALHADEAYDAALVELNRAYELRPSYKLVYNMAQIQLAMKDYAAALRSFRKYLADGGADVPEKRRGEIDAQIATLEQRVAAVTLTTEVPGVEVFVDDVLVGKTPALGTLLLNAGTRKLTLRHPEYDEQTERISVLGGTQRQLAVSLAQRRVVEVPLSANASSDVNVSPAVESPPERDAGDEAIQFEPWMPWLVTGVIGASAVTVGVLTLSANGELSDMRGEADLPRDRLQEQSDHVGNLALATDILFGATLLAGGVSAWLTWGSSEPKEPGRAQASLRFAISPRAAVMSGSF